MLVTFMVTGILYNSRDDVQSAWWFYGSTFFTVSVGMSLLWFGGYFVDSPSYPERKAERVAKSIEDCYDRYNQSTCLRDIARKYDDCELEAGFAVYSDKKPDLGCLRNR